ncbi:MULTISPECIES: hypothetical protein [Antarcticibacterium]|nr:MULTISPECIES: hypothetical protein [Antarcticibacterium]
MSTREEYLLFRQKVRTRKKRDRRYDNLAVFLFFLFMVFLSFLVR